MMDDNTPAVRARATIDDVARRAGVSRATVSQVLGGVGRISPATRDQVARAMVELGYIYNESAANLRRGTSRAVGLLIHDITNPFYAEMTAGVADVLEQDGFLVYLANSAESTERQDRFLHSFRQRGVAGCILCPARATPAATLDQLADWRMPTVIAVRDVADTRFDFVGVDNFGGTQAATTHLIDKGHIDIAFLGGPTASVSRVERLNGFRAAMGARGLNVRPGAEIACAATLQAGCDQVMRLLDRISAITAIVCYHDIVALGALIGLQRSSPTRAHGIAVVGFDDIEASRLWSPTLTTVAIPPRHLGEVVGATFLRRLNGLGEPTKAERVPTQLIARDSTDFVIQPMYGSACATSVPG